MAKILAGWSFFGGLFRDTPFITFVKKRFYDREKNSAAFCTIQQMSFRLSSLLCNSFLFRSLSIISVNYDKEEGHLATDEILTCEGV